MRSCFDYRTRLGQLMYFYTSQYIRCYCCCCCRRPAREFKFVVQSVSRFLLYDTLTVVPRDAIYIHYTLSKPVIRAIGYINAASLFSGSIDYSIWCKTFTICRTSAEGRTSWGISACIIYVSFLIFAVVLSILKSAICLAFACDCLPAIF
jgi:hypothetical protein